MILHRNSVRNPASNIIITDPYAPKQECDLKQCVHCGGHWVFEKGSGKLRGFCQRCMGPTCGPNCVAARPGECKPQDKYLDELAKDARRILSV